MEYPGSKFTRPIRVGMLVFFIAAFFIITPAVILYTAGYRYDWKNGFLRKVGSLSVDIEPRSDVATYLGGVKLKSRMPVELKNVIPSHYLLSIKADGYYDWEKEIEIENQKTVYIKEIGLIKKGEVKNIIEEPIRTFTLSNNYQYILYDLEKDGQTELWLWDKSGQEARKLFTVRGTDRAKITWAENNSCAVVTNQSAPYQYAKVICADRDPVKITDLPTPAINPINKLHWRDDGDPELYYSNRNNIFSFKPLAQQTALITRNGFLDWRMANDELWTLAHSTTSKKYVINKDTLGFKEKYAEVNNLPTVEVADLADNPWRIVEVRRDKVLLKKIGKNEMILLDRDEQFKLAADEVLISPYNNWWLLWSPWELWTYIEGEDPKLLSRSGENLQTVFPLDAFNTLALVWEQKTEATFPYYAVSLNLLDRKITKAAADSVEKLLYFKSEDEDSPGIWALNY